MKNIIIAVVVHTRFDNLKEWIRCYKLSETFGSQLIIIHNYKTDVDINICRNICINENIKYISRPNIGYDIGALQDVFSEKLKDFPNDWDYLFWVTDDVIPMYKKFIPAFFDIAQSRDVGVACLETSNEVKKHIRTSGFMISKDTSKKIIFPDNPIITKQHCYNFEHRSINSFYEQILRMDKKIVQVSPTLLTSHLWDTDHRKGLNRWEQHYKEFPKNSLLFICPIYNSYPQIISSLLCQTNPNWELLLIHDGENTTNLKQLVDSFNDSRITYLEYPIRKNDWGHSLRRWALEEILNKRIGLLSEYITITNPDNYYIPIFVEEMIKGFTNLNIIATYCSHFVHGYLSPNLEGDHKFGVITSDLKLGMIDCGSVVVRKEQACEVGWRSLEIYSDWTYFEDLIKKYGKDKWKKVLGCLFVHN